MIKSLIRSKLLAGLFIPLVVVLALSGSTAHAAVGGLSIGPFLQEVTIKPGQAESSFLITITNSTTSTLPMRLSVVDFGAADDTGAVNFLPTTDSLERKYGLASWMRLEKDAIILAPKTSQRVKIMIENRESLSPGGHYGAVVFQVDNKQTDDTVRPEVDFTKAVSTLVLAKKLGGEKQSLTLTRSTMSGPPIFFPSEIHLRFLNNGNVHTAPVGEITVADPIGRVVSKGMINPEITMVLPETFRIYKTKLPINEILWIPGWSTVTIRYRDPGTNSYVTNVSKVFIITPHAIGLTLTILLVLFISLRYHRQIHKRIHKFIQHTKTAAKKIVQKVKKKIKK